MIKLLLNIVLSLCIFFCCSSLIVILCYHLDIHSINIIDKLSSQQMFMYISLLWTSFISLIIAVIMYCKLQQKSPHYIIAILLTNYIYLVNIKYSCTSIMKKKNICITNKKPSFRNYDSCYNNIISLVKGIRDYSVEHLLE